MTMTAFRILEYDSEPQDGPTGKTTLKHAACSEYIISNNETKLHRVTPGTAPSRKPIQWIHRMLQIGRDVFLPVDWPHSVGSNYLQYQIYDSIQGLSSYLRGVVSTSAVLQAAGVGSSSADAMSAAVAWATRDGIGMLGGLVFSYVASPFFDSHVKEFRLFADVINDVGLTLDMAAPLFPSDKILLVSGIATICKVMCGMAAGATKASITAHFAIRGNMADLNAKESTQETLMTLVGMSLGIALAKQLRSMEERNNLAAFQVVWVVFIFLTIVHVWANYRGVATLHLKTLNRERAELAVKQVADECFVKMIAGTPMDDEHFKQISEQLLPPEQVSESMLAATWKLIIGSSVHLGVPISELHREVSNIGSCALEDLIKLFSFEKYLLGVNTKRKHVFVSLRCGADSRDELKAFLNAMIARRCLQSISAFGSSTEQPLSIVRRTYAATDALFGHDKYFVELVARRGWDVNRLYLGFGRSRADWISKED